ncbi:phage head-tail adapter protein [Staphylococcus devriesei]|uniref:phage head-tail adapter protein n=1 Tax=Staphylococcus devriesei TaxID=586733 RepID=UPI000E690B1B|nr:phage head-tail adapter protein [Staphylococcus devriesei]RIL71522.1 phage head-tail adapter protein [Staphylococcus devriesei]
MENIKITDDILIEFKEYTKISHDMENEHLERLLAMSYSNLATRFGDFDLNSDLNGKNLVFARARYDYEDLLEFFNDNYQDDLLHFGFYNMKERDEDEK